MHVSPMGVNFTPHLGSISLLEFANLANYKATCAIKYSCLSEFGSRKSGHEALKLAWRLSLMSGCFSWSIAKSFKSRAAIAHHSHHHPAASMSMPNPVRISLLP